MQPPMDGDATSSGPSGFKDYFSGVAAGYAQFRPRYPPVLFADLAATAPDRQLAWDCATGNGQAAEGLAGHFEQVVATDASAEQLACAMPHERVRYHHRKETNPGLHDASVDLVTVAQALHWLDLERFYAEVRRVLKPGGVLAVWCYDLASAGADVDTALKWFTYDLLGPYWAPERQHVIAGYRDLPFPFVDLPFPTHVMEHPMTLGELGGFLDTWSALSHYRSVRREDPLPSLLAELTPLWGGPEVQRTVRWPLAGRLGRYSP
jgi:SAM-dependent methyltransferase